MFDKIHYKYLKIYQNICNGFREYETLFLSVFFNYTQTAKIFLSLNSIFSSLNSFFLLKSKINK